MIKRKGPIIKKEVVSPLKQQESIPYMGHKNKHKFPREGAKYKMSKVGGGGCGCGSRRNPKKMGR